MATSQIRRNWSATNDESTTSCAHWVNFLITIACIHTISFSNNGRRTNVTFLYNRKGLLFQGHSSLMISFILWDDINVNWYRLEQHNSQRGLQFQLRGMLCQSDSALSKWLSFAKNYQFRLVILSSRARYKFFPSPENLKRYAHVQILFYSLSSLYSQIKTI